MFGGGLGYAWVITHLFYNITVKTENLNNYQYAS